MKKECNGCFKLFKDKGIRFCKNCLISLSSLDKKVTAIRKYQEAIRCRDAFGIQNQGAN